jgi:hypothetical protein
MTNMLRTPLRVSLIAAAALLAWAPAAQAQYLLLSPTVVGEIDQTPQDEFEPSSLDCMQEDAGPAHDNVEPAVQQSSDARAAGAPLTKAAASLIGPFAGVLGDVRNLASRPKLDWLKRHVLTVTDAAGASLSWLGRKLK